ncbi:hypothetical protein HPC37_02875 [Pasteurellaceae bacterium 20609_3]|nr:hypothetical protein [Spirabiliibacterium mucosae]MBE2897798.1 hypothetical protein [Spirabiliibacterium mucosae]
MNEQATLTRSLDELTPFFVRDEDEILAMIANDYRDTNDDVDWEDLIGQ